MPKTASAAPAAPIPAGLLRALIETSGPGDPQLPLLVRAVIGEASFGQVDLIFELLAGPYAETDPPSDLVVAAANSADPRLLRWTLTHPAVPAEFAQHRLQCADVATLAGLVPPGADEAMVSRICRELSRRCPDPASVSTNDAGQLLANHDVDPAVVAAALPLIPNPEIVRTSDGRVDAEGWAQSRRQRQALLMAIFERQPGARPVLLEDREVSNLVLEHLPHQLDDDELRVAAAGQAERLGRLLQTAHEEAAKLGGLPDGLLARSALQTVADTVRPLLLIDGGNLGQHNLGPCLSSGTEATFRKNVSMWRSTPQARAEALRTIAAGAVPLINELVGTDPDSADRGWLLLAARHAARTVGTPATAPVTEPATGPLADQLRVWVEHLRSAWLDVAGTHKGDGWTLPAAFIPEDRARYDVLLQAHLALDPAAAAASPPAQTVLERLAVLDLRDVGEMQDLCATAGDDIDLFVAHAVTTSVSPVVDVPLSYVPDPQTLLASTVWRLRSLTSQVTPDDRLCAVQAVFTSRHVTDAAVLAMPAYAALHAYDSTTPRTADNSGLEAPTARIARLLRQALGDDAAAWERFWSAPLSRKGEQAWVRLGEVLDAAAGDCPWPAPPAR